MNIIDLAIKGGWLMGVLFALSLIAVALFIERWLTTKKAEKVEEKTFIDVIRAIDQERIDDATNICKLSESHICKILEQGLNYGKDDVNLATETIDQSANQFVRSLEKNLNTLSTLAAIAPLIGFLGTVTGMIKTFYELHVSAGGVVDINILSGGIYEALVTTVGGLIVGIICIVFYNYLLSRIEAIAFVVEAKINQVNAHLRRIPK